MEIKDFRKSTTPRPSTFVKTHSGFDVLHVPVDFIDGEGNVVYTLYVPDNTFRDAYLGRDVSLLASLLQVLRAAYELDEVESAADDHLTVTGHKGTQCYFKVSRNSPPHRAFGNKATSNWPPQQ